MLSKDGLMAVVVSRNPSNRERRGFLSETQLLGPAAAALRYTCSPRIAASFPRRVLKISRICYYSDFGMAARLGIAPEALKALTDPSEKSKILEIKCVDMHPDICFVFFVLFFSFLSESFIMFY